MPDGDTYAHMYDGFYDRRYNQWGQRVVFEGGRPGDPEAKGFGIFGHWDKDPETGEDIFLEPGSYNYEVTDGGITKNLNTENIKVNDAPVQTLNTGVGLMGSLLPLLMLFMMMRQ
jgi:hypothetical protein